MVQESGRFLCSRFFFFEQLFWKAKWEESAILSCASWWPPLGKLHQLGQSEAGSDQQGLTAPCRTLPKANRDGFHGTSDVSPMRPGDDRTGEKGKKKKEDAKRKGKKEKRGKQRKQKGRNDRTKCSTPLCRVPVWAVSGRDVARRGQCRPWGSREGRAIRSAGQEKAC